MNYCRLHFIRKIIKIHLKHTRHVSQDASKRVVITGLGTVSPLCVGTNLFWEKLMQVESGISCISDDRFIKLPSRIAGFVPRGKDVGALDSSAVFTESEKRQFSNACLFASCATMEALRDARWKPSDLKDYQNTGVSIGSSIMSLEYLFNADKHMEKNDYKKVNPYTIPRSLINMPAGYISMKYGFMGASNSVSTACATGAHSIIDAFNLIRNGDCSVVVCGATDSEINPAVVAGFSRCKALSTSYNENPSKASRPFDKNRDGFVISEGAGVLIVEDYNHAKSRGAKIYAEVLGYGLSSDAHHITNPRPDGAGVMLCIHRAIKKSGIEPEEVTYVNAHATSTPVGDKAEAIAIANFFGGHRKNLRVSSIKGSIGHLLAAAGSVESIATILSCYKGMLPPTNNLEDPENFMDLKFVSADDNVWPVNPRTERRIALKNSFGFGGTNACIVFANVLE